MLLQSSPSLPDHPVTSRDYQELTLTTNQYRVSIPDFCKIFIYSLSFEPSVQSDNTQLKKQIIRSLRPEINKYLERFVHCGDNLFSLKDLIQEIQTSSGDDESNASESICSIDNEGSSSAVFEIDFMGCMYKVRVQNCGELDINSVSICKSSALQFYNILLRDKLKALKLIKLGSNRDHFDPQAAIKVPSFPASVWPGYFTSVNLLRGGLMLTVDCAFRLVRNDSVLDVIQEVYKKYGNACREHVRNVLVDSIVMTFYGNQSMYRIDDVLFDESPVDKFMFGSVEVTYEKYFKDKYQAGIRVRNQPLLLARRSFKAEPIRLIPELCRMTGSGSLTDELQLKKEVSAHTKLKPDKRQQKIQTLANRLASIDSGYWNMQTAEESVRVKGKLLPTPSLRTGNKNIRVSDKAAFRFADCQFSTSVNIDRWQLFFTEKDLRQAQELSSSLQSTANSFGISMKNPLMQQMPNMRNMETVIANTLREQIKENAQLVVVMIPKFLQNSYKTIKQILTTEKPVPSQVVFTSSVDRRDPSIYNKILVQIACKTGSSPWSVSLPSELTRGSMLVGIDVCHNTFRAKQSVLGFCASLDQSFTRYYSKVAFHEPNQEISSVLTPLFLESLKQYYQANQKRKPDRIIIYRDGVGTSQYTDVVNHEIPQLIAAVRQFDKTWNPEIVAIVVNKRVNQRFFVNNANPPAGVVVDSEVVWGHYNFYLVSHNACSGTMTPTHYNVVINDSRITSKCLYELTYNLCYMYYNWQGGIRVPAPCMYAHKIAYLVGKNTGVNFNPKLAPSYFYL